MPRGAGLAALPPPAPRSLVPPAEHPVSPVQLVGAVGGARLAALRASGIFSPLPTGAVSEAGSDMACLLMSPSVQRDVLPGRDHPGLAALPAEREQPALTGDQGPEVAGLPHVITLCTEPLPQPTGPRRHRALPLH